MERRGDGLGKMEGCHREAQQYVYHGRGYYFLCGVWPDMVVQVVVTKIFVTMLDLVNPEWFSVKG